MMFIGQLPLMKLGKLAGVLILALILFIVLLRFTPAGVTQYLPDRFSTWQGRLERFFDGHESDTDENGVYKITDDNYVEKFSGRINTQVTPTPISMYLNIWSSVKRLRLLSRKAINTMEANLANSEGWNCIPNIGAFLRRA
mgnify:CR=1 FL=1